MRETLDAAFDCIAVVDPEGRIVEFNAAAERTFGRERADVLGLSIADLLVCERYRSRDGSSLAPSGSDPRIPVGLLEAAGLRADGAEFPMELSVAQIPDGDRPLMALFMRDLTDSREAQSRLRQATAKYEALIEQIPAITYVETMDPRTSLFWATYVSPQIQQVLGVTPQEWTENRALWEEMLHPEDRERAVAADEETNVTGDPFSIEYRLVRADGRVVWVHDEARVLRDEAGRPWIWHGVMLDVTAQMEALELVRRTESRYRTLVETIPAITYVEAIDGDVKTFYMSHQVRDILGYEPERFNEVRFWSSIIHPDDRERVGELDRITNETGEPYAAEYRFTTADGRTVWVRDEAVLVEGGPGGQMAWQGFIVDITHQKQVEEELRRSLEALYRAHDERRRLLARLVGAQEEERRRIASDIHDDQVQQLTALQLRLHLLAGTLAGAEHEAMLEELQETAQNAIGGLRRLLFELRPPALDRDGLAAALRQRLEHDREKFGLEWGFDDRLVAEPPPDVRALVYRATQEGLVNTRKHARAGRVDVLLESRDGGVFVRVADDGVGFDPEAAPDEGLGDHIGLATMRERIELAGGWLRIDSAPGAGTRAELWVPVAGDTQVGVDPMSAGHGGDTRY